MILVANLFNFELVVVVMVGMEQPWFRLWQKNGRCDGCGLWVGCWMVGSSAEDVRGEEEKRRRFGWFVVVTHHDGACNNNISSEWWCLSEEAKEEEEGRGEREINERERERVSFMVVHNYWLH